MKKILELDSYPRHHEFKDSYKEMNTSELELFAELAQEFNNVKEDEWFTVSDLIPRYRWRRCNRNTKISTRLVSLYFKDWLSRTERAYKTIHKDVGGTVYRKTNEYGERAHHAWDSILKGKIDDVSRKEG